MNSFAVSLVRLCRLNVKTLMNDKPASVLACIRHVQCRDLQTSSETDDDAYRVAMKMRKRLRSKSNGPGPALPSDQEDLSRNKRQEMILKELVPDLDSMPSVELVKLLAGGIVYENDDFIAINKPYGLPSHGGPGVRVSVGQLLEPLSRAVDRGQGEVGSLHMVHRLDRGTTGVMLLAKTAEVAWQLLGMFRRREVVKTYWTLTKGTPQPHHGVIDIPLARRKVKDFYKSVVCPVQSGGRRGDERPAVTEYRVLGQGNGVSLVECRPLTGLQHQIRAHLAQGLNCPILGDHKYSHTDRLAPQKLSPESLQRLGIRQAQVRRLPVHLHARKLVLPQWRGRANVFVSAPYPAFFKHSLQRLKIHSSHK